MFPSDSVVVVTGAASGIGRAVAHRLADAGVALALLDRDADPLATVAARAGERHGVRALAVPVDVADESAVHDAIATAHETLGPLTGLVCAAGVLEPAGLDVTRASWDRHLAVNATGVLHCLQAASPRLRDGGAVVVVSSNAARVPRTGMLAYAASKAAVSALTRCAGLELAARGIRCNVVEPGSTDTPMQRDLWPDAAEGARRAVEGDPATFRVGIPLGRVPRRAVGTPRRARRPGGDGRRPAPRRARRAGRAARA
ncbi:SDR family NAD(P)-dependent oxidoreductase [Cellulomonas composti]|uniref:2,3-dihydro-2,3-dihydroxybenzoate dehydrogenase n=1 Tax=Cellulomonas composti TaxID=266130 RepID=A0A511J8I9_9CELL|nr:SDR family NAD(P)-dependent oxidoreductase [Cellulomonas composti]GEL94302.1 2,3-dihydro-2,3-dihydroxybenzoate dehydrogenase [Cellulomonas composti]